MFGGKEEEEDGDGDDAWFVVVVEMEEYMEGRMEEELVEFGVGKMGKVASQRAVSLLSVGGCRKQGRRREKVKREKEVG